MKMRTVLFYLVMSFSVTLCVGVSCNNILGYSMSERQNFSRLLLYSNHSVGLIILNTDDEINVLKPVMRPGIRATIRRDVKPGESLWYEADYRVLPFPERCIYNRLVIHLRSVDDLNAVGRGD